LACNEKNVDTEKLSTSIHEFELSLLRMLFE
jgi:hypothetical protein